MATRCMALTLAAAATAAGCVYEGNFPSQEELYDPLVDPAVLMVHADDRTWSVKVQGNDMVGPDVRLSMYREPSDSAIRGVLWERPVSVDLTRTAATGAVGAAPFRLSVRRDGNVLRAVGTVGWQRSELTWTNERFAAEIGSCHYDLHRIDELTYEGRWGCMGPGVRMTMKVPKDLGQWGDVGSAAALALLLGAA